MAHSVRLGAQALKDIEADMNGRPLGRAKPPSNGWQGRGDPMEDGCSRWLTDNGFRFVRDDQTAEGTQLDFYLPDFDVYIEVKRFHTNRIAEQMSRAKNVIAIQGIECLEFLKALKRI